MLYFLIYDMKGKEIEVRNLSSTAYKTFLSNNAPYVSVAKLKDTDDVAGLGLELAYKTPEDFKQIDYPVKWKEGDYLLLDYPFEYPLYLPLEPCYSLYDLIEQIQSLYYEAYHNKENEMYLRKDEARFEDLVLEKITVCKSGDVIAYVSKNS